MNPFLLGIPAAAALAGGFTALGAAHPRSQLFGATVRHTHSPSHLALTFDDGPNPAITPRLLHLLDRYRVKASFFLIGRFAEECPAITREIAARGHLVGNHTQTHPNLFWLKPAAVRDEIAGCQAVLQRILQASPAYFRPPFGFRNPWVVGTARQLGMQTVMWTLLPGDWRAKSVDWLVQRMNPIADRARKAADRPSGDLLCLHDGAHRALGGDRNLTLTALEYWLPRWRDLGLKFVTISEAVGTPAG
jgi:peptidoglycan-N-acetylglucosamine deacetylase